MRIAQVLRERHNDRGGPSRDTAESREPESAGKSLRRQPKDRRQMEKAVSGSRSANGAERTTLNRSVN
jgi:hypothetical protein